MDWRKCLWRLLAAALYLWGLWCCCLAREAQSRVFLQLDQPVSLGAAKECYDREMEEETPVGLCFWGQTGEITISCETTGGRARVTRVVLCGNGELMEAGELVWREGCLIDRETALELFGTIHCGGQILEWDGASYPVLGTVSALRPTVITMAREEDTFSGCVLAASGEKGTVTGEQFFLRHQLSGRVLDYYFLWALTRNLLLLFPGIAALSAWGWMEKDRRQLSVSGIRAGEQWGMLIKTGLSWILMGISLVLLWKLAVIPPDMIPSRWSDFSFWGDWWENQMEELVTILFAPLENRQLQMLLNMVKSMISATAAAALALCTLRRENHADIAHRG